MAILMVGAMSMVALLPRSAFAQTLSPVPDSGVATQSAVVAPTAGQSNTRTFLPLLAYNRCALTPTFTSHPFGVQAYGYLGPASAYYCDLVDSGSTWLRNEISWEATEPQDFQPAVYSWSAADSVVETARIGGFNLIITVIRNPEWAATSPEGVIDRVPLSRFASFVNALVERYDGDGIDDAPGSPRIRHWEFYNEPDAAFIRNDHRWGNNGKEYAEMLAAVYPAVKAANPNAQVLLGGIAYDWFEDQGGPFVRTFLDDVLANDGGQYFDIMNFHQYPTFALNWGSPNGPGLVEKTAAVRAKLAEYGLQKPIFITESGMHSNDAIGNPMTPELQARYTAMLLAQTLAADVDNLTWWMLHDPGVGYPFRNGLVTSVTANNQRPERKPSFFAYRTAVSFLAQATFVRTLTTAETGNAELIAYKNSDQNGKDLYVAWLGPVTRSDSAPLRLPGAAATVFDLYGTSRIVTDSDDGQADGAINVHVGAQPLYVRIES